MQRSARSPSDCAVPPGQDGQPACRTSGWRSEATPIPTRSTRTTAEQRDPTGIGASPGLRRIPPKPQELIRGNDRFKIIIQQGQ